MAIVGMATEVAVNGLTDKPTTIYIPPYWINEKIIKSKLNE